MIGRRHFDTTENAELRAKIDEAKRSLPLPDLMEKEGLGDRAKKTAHCPFHDDQHKSFSVLKGADGFWPYKCFTGCGKGDEIDFLAAHFSISRREAIKHYLKTAGFPARVPHRSREYPESPKFPECPECPETRKSHGSPKSPMFPVYPMSNGQELEQALKASAARNACKEGSSEKKALWQLARDLVAVQKRSGRKLSNSDWVLALREWHRICRSDL